MIKRFILFLFLSNSFIYSSHAQKARPATPAPLQLFIDFKEANSDTLIPITFESDLFQEEEQKRKDIIASEEKIFYKKKLFYPLLFRFEEFTKNRTSVFQRQFSERTKRYEANLDEMFSQLALTNQKSKLLFREEQKRRELDALEETEFQKLFFIKKQLLFQSLLKWRELETMLQGKNVCSWTIIETRKGDVRILHLCPEKCDAMVNALRDEKDSLDLWDAFCEKSFIDESSRDFVREKLRARKRELLVAQLARD
ncbi:hypothetical protein HYV11_00630 [Candidatus Dependentiae bacterium]|nr:hypothetical protein [Candidatus Dependentiae bacterium]